jgi:D-glycero-alpha-D-manno-heptose-7-phosphate kinase
LDIPNNVRARAPLRLGLAGGGTDLSPYCDEFGGAVLNVTIERYAYAFIEPAEDGMVHLVAPDLGLEECFPADLVAFESAKLQLHAGVARRFITQFADRRVPPMRITSFVDAPPGSGLGSSSALVVALVEAFRARFAIPLGPYDVAHLAFEVERQELNLAGGKQDHYAAAFGGVNFIEFLKNDRVIVNPLRVPVNVVNELELSLVICFSGVSRSSDRIIAEQQRQLVSLQPEAMASMHQLKADALEMKEALLRGEIQRLSKVLNRSWQAKKRTASGISTDTLDAFYETAMAAGAYGGKVSGAGGGGFMMFIVEPARRVHVINALRHAGGIATGVHLTNDGAASWRI